MSDVEIIEITDCEMECHESVYPAYRETCFKKCEEEAAKEAERKRMRAFQNAIDYAGYDDD